jgi:hypothetical protein
VSLERDQAIKPPSYVKHEYLESEMTEMVEILWQSSLLLTGELAHRFFFRCHEVGLEEMGHPLSADRAPDAEMLSLVR